MKKIHIVASISVALLACCMFMTQSAFAEVHLWLIKGNDVVTLTSVQLEGELLFTDLKVPLLGEVMFLCSGTFGGSVGSEGEGEITEVLTLSSGPVALAAPLLCESQTIGCTDPKLSADNLPWHSQLELMSGMSPPEETLDIILGTGAPGGEPGWELICETAFGNIEDLCEALPGEVQAGIENMAAENDVLAIFDTETGLTPMAECTLNSEHVADVVGEGLITTLNGETLAVSAP